MKSFKLTFTIMTAVFAANGLEAKYALFADEHFMLPEDDDRDSSAIVKEEVVTVKVPTKQTPPAQEQPKQEPKEKIIYVEQPVYVPVPTAPVYVQKTVVQPVHVHQHTTHVTHERAPVYTRPTSVYIQPTPVQQVHMTPVTHEHAPIHKAPVTYVHVTEKKSLEITNTQPGASKTQIVLIAGLTALAVYVLYKHVCNQ